MVSIHLHDLPEPLLLHIFSFISPTRTRNSASLVCRKWCLLERQTRLSLTLRGNPFTLPYPPQTFPSFPSLASLDLSHLSPWGHPLCYTPLLVGPTLPASFPKITHLTLYSRDPTALACLAPHWPRLKKVKLVRWHNKPNNNPAAEDLGSDLDQLFANCREIEEVDLNEFYCWTEDVTEALKRHPEVVNGLSALDLMLADATDGFRASEILDISVACPNLQRLVAPCVFNPRYMDFVSDSTLKTLATNCPRLTTLHLIDPTPPPTPNTNPNSANHHQENNPLSSAITPTGLETLFSSLSLLTDFSLDLSHPISDSGPALETLGQRRAGPPVKTLKLGFFRGICKARWLHLDGVSVCGGLESLCIKNCADLSDASLAAIARGCKKLKKIELVACNSVTESGIKRLANGLRGVLKDVSVSGCTLIDAAGLVQALELVRGRLERLHMDCVWVRPEKEMKDGRMDDVAERDRLDGSDDVAECDRLDGSDDVAECDRLDERPGKRCRVEENGGLDFACANHNNKHNNSWDNLVELSLWLPAGELLFPLSNTSLITCSNLQSITIKVEGDCRILPRPVQRTFGLNTLSRFPKLAKMKLDLGEAIGYSLTAPSGQMDLSLWERFYLHGIQDLGSLQELDYWPPQDREVNQRSLSLPSAALIKGCCRLRKLFIHGTAHEHFMRFFLGMEELRDVQLREDYYPAPENDMSTEMRADSCGRFELALNERILPD
ncbi:hypothetical protein LUZ60_013304 [Juncus effusus]|nr:hypothetical protein LUZ60_013304 [Juncus effusus]